MTMLKESVKVFIVQSLACFESPQQVADAVKQNFNIEIERQQVAAYDPTKLTGKNLSQKYKDLFRQARTDFKANVEDIPIANTAFHFKALQQLYDDWGKNKTMKQNVLRHAQGLIQTIHRTDPSGLSEKAQLELEIKRLELEKLKREVNPTAAQPPEEDYKVLLKPDEDIPNEPIL